MATFEKDCGVCGYHVYQRVWDAANGETLTCGRELTNKSDRYAVAVMKDSRDLLVTCRRKFHVSVHYS